MAGVCSVDGSGFEMAPAFRCCARRENLSRWRLQVGAGEEHSRISHDRVALRANAATRESAKPFSAAGSRRVRVCLLLSTMIWQARYPSR
jgi:hypothetical protein